MGKHKKNKRAYKLIGFKAFLDTDADLIAWWESIEEGDRSDVIRDVIREFIGLQPRTRGRRIDIPELLQVREDAAWIRSALNEMPVFVERMMHEAVSRQPLMSAEPLIQETKPKLERTEKQRRTNRLDKATW